MFVDYLQKTITYIKGVQEIALFATMADSRWFMVFGASPLFYVMLPFIGILLTLNALISGYHLAKASNKNWDLWLNFITSVACALLASISLYGAVVSVFLGVSFSMGPWFFFSSLLVGFVQQTIMLGLNFFRAYESEPGSAQRKHYLQAGINNLFILTLLAAAISSVVFIMLFPAAIPLLGTISALVVVALTLVDIFWRILPINWKAKVKNFVGLEQSETAEPRILAPSLDNHHKAEAKIPAHSQLFIRPDYSAQIREMEPLEARNYLLQLIEKKLNFFQAKGVAGDKKTADKVSLLQHMQQVVTNESQAKLTKKEGSLAFQSFWMLEGDVEQIFKAVNTFQNHCSNMSSEPLREQKFKSA